MISKVVEEIVNEANGLKEVADGKLGNVVMGIPDAGHRHPGIVYTGTTRSETLPVQQRGVRACAWWGWTLPPQGTV